MMKNLRIVFMGTPEFAVATLGALLMNGFNVAAVVTTPDKPAGRGRKIKGSAVKEFAGLSHLPVLQPGNLKDPGFINDLKKLNPDVFIVVAFRMLPEAVWRIPPMGTVNLHASLLPFYRGAAPINRAIMNGEKVTGVTTFLIDGSIDTGNILLREETRIYPFEDAGDIHNRLMKLGARLVIRTLEGIADKTITPLPQSVFLEPGVIPKPAPRIFPADTVIRWDSEPADIHNFIRGLSPQPGARSSFRRGKDIISFKIQESLPEVASHGLRPGYIVSDGKRFLKVACNKGFISIASIQPEGKKRMSIPEFLRGFDINGITVPFS